MKKHQLNIQKKRTKKQHISDKQIKLLLANGQKMTVAHRRSKVRVFLVNI